MSFKWKIWLKIYKRLLTRKNIVSIQLKLSIDKTRKVLGLNWSTKNDEFIYDMKGTVDLAEQLKPTKRNILKISALFYDTLGLIAPIVL